LNKVYLKSPAQKDIGREASKGEGSRIRKSSKEKEYLLKKILNYYSKEKAPRLFVAILV
jgi:hypothetical protein